MAEIILKVGDSIEPNRYEDCDIIVALSDKRISLVHAQNICNHRHIGFKSNGLRDINSLPFKMFSEFYQYRLDRVSTYEVQRTELSSGESSVSYNVNWPGYYQQRLKHPTHLIFGEVGREISFNGDSDFSQTKVDNVWAQITAFTGQLKENYSLWPIGLKEPFTFLPIGLDADLSDSEVTELEAVIVDEDGVIIKNRANFIQWQDMPLMSPLSIGKVNNVNTAVDKRTQYPINLLKNKQVKNG